MKVNRVSIIVLLLLILSTSVTLWQRNFSSSFAKAYNTHATILLNEFMASNGETIADENGDFEDWIELYNDSAEPIALAGYGLSDDPERPFRWVFPDVTIAPGDYLLVWASGKDRTNPNQPLHTNFSISAAGELLLLTHPDGTLLDQIGPLPVPRDISYGRQPDGNGNWYFFDQPTPGSSNNDSPAYIEILEPPTFSHQAGFYTQPFDLTISASDPDVTIIYTLDGSIPDVENINGRTYTFKNQYPSQPGYPLGALLTDSYYTYFYQQPIVISDRSSDPDKLTHKSSTRDWYPNYYFPDDPVYKGTVVRARATKPGALPSSVQTHTFFVTPEGRQQYTLPIISISMSEDGLFGYEQGIYTAGIDFDQWRIDNPGMESRGNTPANYHRRGNEAEVMAHFELIEPDMTNVAFSQDIGIRIHGGWSRAHRIKSLRLYARAGYGNAEFGYPIFPEQPYDNYRRLILRNSGQDHHLTLFRDAAIQQLVAHLDFDTQAYRPAIVFINGEYWGIHNIRERLDRHYLAQIYSLDADNVDILTNKPNVVEVKEGDVEHFRETIAYILANGLTNNERYEYIQTRIDVANFRDYQIAQIYVGNVDWPQNNSDYWRLKTDTFDPDAPHGHDGRWRWLMYDTDWGLGLHYGPELNTLARASRYRSIIISEDIAPFATQTAMVTADYMVYLPAVFVALPYVDLTEFDHRFLLTELLTNESFKWDFINRFADLLNTAFLPERMTAVIQSLQQTIEPEVAAHIDRWSIPDSYTLWQDHVDVMIDYANERPYHQRQHIRDKFDIAGDYTLTVNVSDPTHGYVRVNTIDLVENTPGVAANPYPWSGIYFQGVPIELEAVPAPGYKFVGWQGLPAGTAALTTQTFTQDVAVTAVFIEISLLHYWHFNHLPAGAITAVAADHTLLGNATITYPGTGIGYMDRVNDGTTLNTWLNNPAGNGLRVRNPSTTRELHLNLPTTGYDHIIFSYAAKRTDNGATHQTLYYRLSDESDWIQFGDSFTIPADYTLFTFDFSDMSEVNDNPQFAVRILFSGGNAAGSSGNNRFDNITVTGIIDLPFSP